MKKSIRTMWPHLSSYLEAAISHKEHHTLPLALAAHSTAQACAH